MDRATFIVDYPEFANVDPDYVDAKLALAIARIDLNVYGARADEAQGMLAAHLLWTSPAGSSLRLDGDPGDKPNRKSRYWREYCQVRREVGIGFMAVR